MRDVTERNQNFDKLPVRQAADSPLHNELFQSLQANPTKLNRVAAAASELIFSHPYPNSAHASVGATATRHGSDHDAAQRHASHGHSHDQERSGPVPRANPTEAEIRRMKQEWNRDVKLPDGERAPIKASEEHTKHTNSSLTLLLAEIERLAELWRSPVQNRVKT
jgi:hypothetical protein